MKVWLDRARSTDWTKNIQKGQVRSRIVHTHGDVVSEHDVDFDWAMKGCTSASANIG
jgi:hypothetical protein